MMPADWMQAALAAAPPQGMRYCPPPVPGRVLHMDGDVLAYWAGGNEDTSVGVSRQNAIQKIESLRDYSASTSVVMHLTGADSTKGDRYLIATVRPYQGNRKSGRKPKNWGYLRGLLVGYTGSLFQPKVWASREADDGISLCAYDAARKGQPLVAISSTDKDMRMLPGYHTDWSTYDVTHVPHGAFDVVGNDGKQYGHKWFWLQLLQGDTADNIPGLPQYASATGLRLLGPKTAELLLEDCKDNAEAYETVLGLYQSFYGLAAKAALVEQAMLLWLRTDMGGRADDFLQVCPRDPELAAYAAIKIKQVGEAYAEAINFADQAAA